MNSAVDWQVYLDARLSALERHISDQIAPVAKDVADIKIGLIHSTNRIRALEKAQPWRTLAEITTGIIATIGVLFGLKNN